MATTSVSYTGNGSTTNYSFTFQYIKQSDIKASLDGTATTAFTFANATTLSFNTAPADGVIIKIFRETDDSSIEATFFPGSAIKAEDLNDNFTQAFYIAQETRNTTIEASTGNLPDLSITTNLIADGAVTDAKMASVDSAKATFTQSGTGAVQRTVESRLTDSICAFDFMTEDEVSSVTTGTVNGAASFLDVTNALQAAINAAKGKELILPPGIYHISSTLSVPSFTRLQGSGTSSLFPNFGADWVGNRVASWGYRATTIQYLNGHGTVFNTASYCQFDGLVIRNHLARTTADIVFNAGVHYKFTNCVVQNMEGLMPDSGSLTTGACLIDGCQFTACTRAVSAIFLDAKVVNNTFTSCTQNVFSILSGGGLNSFIGNRFDFCENAAIEFQTNSRTNRVIGNNFDAHGTVALFFNETVNKNIISGNQFWRCGRTKSPTDAVVYDDTNAFVKIKNSREQYFVGNVFLRGTPDAGNDWAGPAFVIGVENCVDQKNYFIGNTINRTSCYNHLPIRDDSGTSSNCIEIDSIFIGNVDAGQSTDIGGPALTTGRFMTKPTVCYITEDKEVTGYANAFANLILTADTGPFGQAAITFTNNGGTLAIGGTSMIDNITYNGRLYYVKNSQQYADGFINTNRTQGNWGLYRLIYQQTPQVVSSTTYIGVIKTVSGTPDVWKAFGPLSP